MMAEQIAEACAPTKNRLHFQGQLRQGQPLLDQHKAWPRNGRGPHHPVQNPRRIWLSDPHRCSRRTAMRPRSRGGGCDPDPRLPLSPNRSPPRRRRDGCRDKTSRKASSSRLGIWAMSPRKSPAQATKRIMLCDRGTSFGYNTLVSDFRGLPIMAATGYPVVF